MWGAVWITPLKVFGNIRSIEKSVHLFGRFTRKTGIIAGIQASISITHILRCVRKS
jgi:hypothetical protein